jgi:hypothetical protein
MSQKPYSERWSIYIDMEGFSALYAEEDQILWSLGELMRAIFRIGTRVYPNETDRIFVHQTGDGFIILSDFHEPSPIRPIAIATVLLSHVASSGRFARAAISEGELADIVGCYPKEIRDAKDREGDVILGDGLMTIFPVMGTGLIRAVQVEKAGPSGPLLLIDSALRSRIPAEVQVTETGTAKHAPLSVDWIHLKHNLVSDIRAKADLTAYSPQEIEKKLIAYQRNYKLDKWVENLRRYLNLEI